MTYLHSFDDIADAAIEMVAQGMPASRVLERFPRHAAALRPLLGAAEEVRSSPLAPPPSERLAGNFASVRAALRGAHPLTTPAGSRAWWRRRLHFASMSLPAGVAAGLLLAGVAAAAAGTVSQTGDLPRAVTHAITLGHKGGSPAPGVHGGSSTPDHEATTAVARTGTPGVNPGVAGETPKPTPTTDASVVQTATVSAGAASGTPGAEAATPVAAGGSTPAATTRSGVIHDVYGNTFRLTSADGDWNVNIDANTVVTGTIAEGASAEVTGDLTAGKNLHAATVDVTAPDHAQTPTATPTPPGKGNATGPSSGHTPTGGPETPAGKSKGH